VWQGNAYEGLTCNALEWIASSDGGTFISPEGEVTVNNDRAIAALELAASWVGTISPPGITGFQEEDARNAFQAGNAAFQRNWPYAYVLANAPDSVVRDRFGIAPLPGMEAGRSASTLGGWQIAVSAYSGQPEAAVHFARYVTGYEEQLNYALETSNLPTIASVYEDERILSSEVAWLAELLPVFQAAVARPSTVTAPTYGEASRLIFSTVHDVLLGTTDASTALALLEDDLQALTGLPTGTP
jgi:trehalose/maltose transport system substrate-binding protein